MYRFDTPGIDKTPTPQLQGENMNKHGTPANLKTNRSTEEARLNGKKGGIASGEARRKKKALQDWIEIIGNTTPPEEMITALEEKGIQLPPNATLDCAVVLTMYLETINGSVQAFKAIADIQGKKTSITEEETPDALSAALMAIAHSMDKTA